MFIVQANACFAVVSMMEQKEIFSTRTLWGKSFIL
jgi:hypothetical protein